MAVAVANLQSIFVSAPVPTQFEIMHYVPRAALHENLADKQQTYNLFQSARVKADNFGELSERYVAVCGN